MITATEGQDEVDQSQFEEFTTAIYSFLQQYVKEHETLKDGIIISALIAAAADCIVCSCTTTSQLEEGIKMAQESIVDAVEQLMEMREEDFQNHFKERFGKKKLN